jgi:hypothetical protein
LVIRPTKRKAFGGDDSQLRQHRTGNRSPRREARESQANDEPGGARFIVRNGEVTEIVDLNLTFTDEKPATEAVIEGGAAAATA